MVPSPAEQDRVRLRCFGELEIVRPDGSAVDPIFMLPRRAAVFLYLALLDPPRPVPRPELASMFWPFLTRGSAEHHLDRSLFSLHQYLGEVWAAEDDAVSIVRDLIWCDVWAFREALARGELERAVAIYRGPLLDRPGLHGAGDFQTWLETERERLRRAAMEAIASLAARAAGEGEWERAALVFREGARAEPMEESNLRCFMVAMVQAGRRQDALRIYELLHRRLKLRYGRSPEGETTALADVIRKGAQPPLEPFLPA